MAPGAGGRGKGGEAMGSSTLVDAVADVAAAVDWGDLPPSAAAAAERCALHVLATTYLGGRRAIARQVVDYVRHTSQGPATLVGHDAGAAAAEAAFANATLCHADFRDDSHAQSQSHPGVTVIPAVLAAAELAGGTLPPATIGSAIAAGYQVTGRLGRLGAVASTERGFRASAIYTVFGAAAGAARVLGLDRERLGSAIALAAHAASGLNQPFLDGTDDWLLLPGQAARGGLVAALLAREGVPGAPRILDGDLGFFRAYAGLDTPLELEPPGLPPYEIEVVRLKTVLTCGWNQAAVNAVLDSGVALDDIDAIAVTLSPEAHGFPGVANPSPVRTFTEAALALPFALGTLLATGTLEAHSYDDVTLPAVAEAARRVRVGARPDFAGYDTEVTITRRDGTRVELKVPGDEPRWLRSTPEVVASLRGKFAAAGLDAGKVDLLAAAVPRALGGADIMGLMGILRAPA